MSLLAFNWVGYRLLSGMLEQKADLALEKRIDNADYDEKNLIELKVPLNAPYLPANSTAFERVDGEIEIEGTHYKYVKRKVVDGELVLLCIPNEGKTKIQNSRVDFFKLVNDLNQSSNTNKNKNTASFKSFTTEYRQEDNAWSIPVLQKILVIPALRCNYSTAAGFDAIPEQPPKVC